MEQRVAKLKIKPKPFLFPEYCKGCGRCIEACRFECISVGNEINPETGLMPVVMDLEKCTGCGLCWEQCLGMRIPFKRTIRKGDRVINKEKA